MIEDDIKRMEQKIDRIEHIALSVLSKQTGREYTYQENEETGIWEIGYYDDNGKFVVED